MSDATTTRVYLVRHCDVRNPGGVLYGHLPGFPLSQRGEREAENLGRFFADKPIRGIYSSPLERAVQTASAIAALRPGLAITQTAELIEAKFGLYLQGVTYAKLPWRRPLWFLHRLRRGLLPGDESLATMAARVEAPLLRLVREFPGEGGICVSHGDPIQAFWARSQGHRGFTFLGCAKGGVLQLDYEHERLVTTTYLPPAHFGDAGEPPTTSGTGTKEAGVGSA